MSAHLTYALQLSLGIVFVLAAIPKLRDPGTFTRTVAEYRLLPRGLTPGFATSVIAIESFLGFAFLIGWMIPIALPLAAVILILFCTAVAINLHRGQIVPCGCFGRGGETISNRSLVRLSTLLVAVVAVMVARSPNVTVTTLFREGPSGLAYLVQISGVVGFFMLSTAWLLSLPELRFILRRAVRAEHRVRTEKGEG